jgi:hypothetical protein
MRYRAKGLENGASSLRSFERPDSLQAGCLYEESFFKNDHCPSWQYRPANPAEALEQIGRKERYRFQYVAAKIGLRPMAETGISSRKR